MKVFITTVALLCTICSFTQLPTVPTTRMAVTGDIGLKVNIHSGDPSDVIKVGNQYDAWYWKVNGESINDTRSNPFYSRLRSNDVLASKDGKLFYLHILYRSKSGKNDMNSFSTQVKAVAYLTYGKEASLVQEYDVLKIKLPEEPSDQDDRVIGDQGGV